MAQKVLVELVDDLDGTSSKDVSTVQFSIDGVDYEIDLSSANAEHLRDVCADYVSAARRTGGRLKRGVRPANKPAEAGDAATIRNWALDNGFTLSGRGRIPAHVIEAYSEAQTPKKPIRTKTSTTAKGSTKRRVSTKKA